MYSAQPESATKYASLAAPEATETTQEAKEKIQDDSSISKKHSSGWKHGGYCPLAAADSVPIRLLFHGQRTKFRF